MPRTKYRRNPRNRRKVTLSLTGPSGDKRLANKLPRNSRIMRNLLGSQWSVIPPEVLTKMTYVEEFKRVPGIPVDDYRYVLNSIFDPDFTSTGHQPLGHDQWNGFYGRYRVIRADVTVMLKNHSSFDAVYLALTPSFTSTTLSSAELAAEQPYAVSSLIGQATGQDVKIVRRSYNLPELASRTMSQYCADDQYSAGFGASPPRSIYLHIVASNVSGSNLDLSYSIRIEYTVQLMERITLQQS